MKVLVKNQIILILTILVNIWIVSCGVISEIDPSDSVSQNEEIIPVKVILDGNPEKVGQSENITQDLIPQLRTPSKRRKKPQYEEEDHRKVVIQVNQDSNYRPDCPNPNEEWSYDENCDTECDIQGTHYGEYGHGLFGRTLEKGLGAVRYGSRCRRMVSDVLWEEGHNITRREDLGYPPEPMEEYLARTKRNYGHHDNSEYVIVDKDTYYNRPRGKCVCRRNYARLYGRCVPQTQCPQLSCDLRTQVYIACAPCPKTCLNAATYDLSLNCGTCSPRCVCKGNLVEHATTCIELALCPIVAGPSLPP